MRNGPFEGFQRLDLVKVEDDAGRVRRAIFSDDDLILLSLGRAPQGIGFWEYESRTDSHFYVSAPAAELAAAIRGKEA